MRYTCPCCGYRTLDSQPGSYDICPICSWEDDPIQLASPDYAGGANTLSLIDAQKNFLTIGVSNEKFLDRVKKPSGSEERDSEWHPFDPSRDKKYEGKFTKDMTSLYYWKR